jgi:hypothetical protein
MPIIHRGQSAGWSNATSITINKPAGLAVGDLIVSHIRRNTPTAEDPTEIPSIGTWNLQSSWLSTVHGAWTYTCIADAACVAATNFTWRWGATGRGYGYNVAFYGVDRTLPIQSVGTIYTDTALGKSIDIPGITTTADRTTVLIIGSIYDIDTVAITYTMPNGYIFVCSGASTTYLQGIAMAMGSYHNSGTETGLLQYPINLNNAYRYGIAIALNEDPPKATLPFRNI